MNELIDYEGVCRTALATHGLLKTVDLITKQSVSITESLCLSHTV